MSVFPLSFIVLWTVFALSGIDSFSSGDTNQVNRGLQAGQGIAQLLEAKKFSESLQSIGRNIGPYLGAIGPFVGFVMAFIPVSDPVLEQLKNMMTRIDNRFDQMDERFNNIERKIDWSAVKINFVSIEQNILAMTRLLERVYEVPKSGTKDAIENFQDSYSDVFEQASIKLYQAIVNKNGVFQKDLATSVMKYTKYNRRETQDFLMGVMKLLLQAIKVELSYYAMRKEKALGNFIKQNWEKQIEKVIGIFEKADQTCVDKYHDQLYDDIMEYAIENKHQSNKEFSRGLYYVLIAKYYWRDWFVAAYNEIQYYDNHCVTARHGYYIFRTHGRNFLVSSEGENVVTMDIDMAKREMENVALRTPSFWSITGTRKRSALEIYKDLDTTGSCSVGIIKCGEDLYIIGVSKRLVYTNRCPNFVLWMFG